MASWGFDLNSIEWIHSHQPVAYEDAMALMDQRVKAIACNTLPGCLWFLEHPPLVTIGTSGKATDIKDPSLPVYHTNRGGKVTYHGPGQRIVYVMLDLRVLGQDIRQFVWFLEAWIMAALQEMGLSSFTDPHRVGVWINDGGHEKKIAAIGVRVRKWVTLHGFAVNVTCEEKAFDAIVPCGLSSHGVTSLQSLVPHASMDALDDALKQTFTKVMKYCYNL